MNDKEREYIQSLTDQEAVDCVIKRIDESYDKDYVAKLLSLMKNPKYCDLLRCRYIEEMDSAKNAKMLGMTMDFY